MKERALTLASVGAAIAASLCCLGPIAAVLLGLGTFAAAEIFEKFRPYLLGITGLLLAGAYYVAYRSNQTAACTEAGCPPKSWAKRSKIFLWFATALVAVVAALPYYSSLFVLPGTAATAGLPGLTLLGENLKEVELEVRGMT